jgi:hypothetical protein
MRITLSERRGYLKLNQRRRLVVSGLAMPRIEEVRVIPSVSRLLILTFQVSEGIPSSKSKKSRTLENGET